MYAEGYEYEDPYHDNKGEGDGPSESYEDIDPNEENDGESSEESYFYNLASDSLLICKKYGAIREKFSSNNAFHNHVRTCDVEVATSIKFVKKSIPDLFVIRFKILIVVKNDLGFRNYQYATI